jgi:hypothetical protein
MNSLVRTTQRSAPAASGNWWWDGSNWQCGCDGSDGFPWCPPPGWPPPGCPPWFSGANSPPWYPGANAGISFGLTAPTNPVRGHLWWDGTTLWLFDGAAWVDSSGGGTGGNVVVSDTAPSSPVVGEEWWNAEVLRVWDGSAWNLVGPGSFIGPVGTTTHFFQMSQPTNLTLSSTTDWAMPQFTGSPNIDIQTAWNATSHKLTPTKGGVYMFLIRALMVSGATTGSYGQMLLKNDAGIPNSGTVLVQQINSINATSYAELAGTCVALMNGTTDFVRYWAYNTAGTYNATSNVIDGWILP